jgi:hypothetical protein
MKQVLGLFFLMSLLGQTTAQQTLFDQSAVHSIYINLPPDSLQVLIDEVIHDRYLLAEFIYVAGNQRDTIKHIGLRLRGNTSLAAQKKSFKISFNEFEPGRKYQGVKKLNLRGSHNDPSLIREKLWFDLAHRAGDPLRRTSFVRVYLNGAYRGLYTNLEEIDKEWLEDAFALETGNLYKCTYPADLKYHGPLQGTYTSILNNPTERAYDLVTNETANNYSGLIHLMRILDWPITPSFRDSIESVLDVESALRGYALSIATGHWDDYFYNKNNYYLYHDPSDGKFSFFHFDTDNTMGVDWLNEDWSTREALLWQYPNQPRPLGSKLLAVPEYLNRFAVILDSITRHITHPDTMWVHMSSAHQLIKAAAISDPYRPLDYNYSVQDFENSLTENNIDSHTPWGIKPFFERRAISTINQIEPLITSLTTTLVSGVNIFPNPAQDWLQVQLREAGTAQLKVFDVAGRQVLHASILSQDQRVSLTYLQAGYYTMHISQADKSFARSIIIIR